MGRFIAALVAFVLVAGCTSDVANRYYAAERYPAVPPERVEVLSAAPARPYEVIADFQSRGDTAETLRHKAADIGAHAVIVTKLGGTSPHGQEWADDQTTYHGSAEDRIVGTAIRYK